MNDKKLKAFETAISRHLEELQTLAKSEFERDKLHLHGTAMDDVLKSVNELKNALERIKDRTFGQCIVCDNGDEVEMERLESDYTLSVCLSHYSDEQLRNLEKDLELTARVQKDLLPCCAPDNSKIEFAHFSKPAGIVSGDYYDFFDLADNNQGIVIADVMGKGLSASILMANIQATLRTLGPQYDDVGALTTRINDLFSYNLKIIRFISLVLVRLDLEKGIMEYSNAGHNPPLFWNNKAGNIELFNPTGPAIGLIKNSVYGSSKIELSPQDMLLMYTDGLTEARDKNGNEYGDEKLIQFFKKNKHLTVVDFLKELQRSVMSYKSGILQDDITMVAMKILS